MVRAPLIASGCSCGRCSEAVVPTPTSWQRRGPHRAHLCQSSTTGADAVVGKDAGTRRLRPRVVIASLPAGVATLSTPGPASESPRRPATLSVWRRDGNHKCCRTQTRKVEGPVDGLTRIVIVLESRDSGIDHAVRRFGDQIRDQYMAKLIQCEFDRQADPTKHQSNH